MPTRLASASFAFRQQALERASNRQTRKRGAARSPWGGFLPDIDPHLLDGSSANDILGLLAQRAAGGAGEVLRPGPGWAQLDSARLSLGDDAATINDITLLSQLERSNAAGDQTGEYITTPIACTAGTTGTAGSREFYRINAAGAWTEIAHSTNGTAADAGRENLIDFCNFAGGSVNRTSHSGAIDQPVQIWCTDPGQTDNDAVYIFPCDAVSGGNDHKYEEIVSQAVVSSLDPFMARSCEAFAKRVYYFNTSESGEHHRQRLRRSALFDCDPDPDQVGAGAHDFREFSGDGVRIETLGTVMATYFEDGVAFVRETGQQAAPDAFQILTTRRGLMGTQALTTVGRNEHFGIFTDGWWFLSASGQWREAGVAEINGTPVHKWKSTFYNRLDEDNRHRLITHYDRPNNLIYIGLPTVGNDVSEVWIYDVDRDRVFIEDYAVTAFGAFSAQIKAAVQIDNLPGSIDDLGGSIDSYGALFGLEAMVHGNADGYVFQHDDSIITREDNDGTAKSPAWRYTSPVQAIGDIATLKTSDRITMEYINVGNASARIEAIDDAGNADGGNPSTNQGNVDAVEVAHQYTRLTARNLGFRLSGSGDVKIRSVQFDYFEDQTEEIPSA